MYWPKTNTPIYEMRTAMPVLLVFLKNSSIMPTASHNCPYEPAIFVTARKKLSRNSVLGILYRNDNSIYPPFWLNTDTVKDHVNISTA